jgi:tetratricopeptide (TPR) repeat protein
MTDLKELFGKAEHERIHGSTEKAIVLYARILSLNPNPEMRIEALHMLGVCLRVVGRYEESVGHLWDVLDLSIDDRRRAHVLRDRADSYRCLKDFSGARKDIRDSYEIYCRIDGSPSERGATLGFEARLDFNESYVYHALLLGQQAAALLAEGGDGEPQLYNELWLARIKVHAGLNPKFPSRTTGFFYGRRLMAGRVHVPRAVLEVPTNYESVERAGRDGCGDLPG